MSSDISMGDQFLWVSNMELHRLIAFALEVAPARAETAQHEDFITRLRDFYDNQYFPGCGFDLAERFPTIEERKFWARCFDDVARRIFLRELGSHDVSFWQSSAIGDAYIVARMLTRSVQESESGWHPRTENSDEAASYYGRVKLRV